MRNEYYRASLPFGECSQRKSGTLGPISISSERPRKAQNPIQLGLGGLAPSVLHVPLLRTCAANLLVRFTNLHGRSQFSFNSSDSRQPKARFRDRTYLQGPAFL